MAYAFSLLCIFIIIIALQVISTTTVIVKKTYNHHIWEMYIFMELSSMIICNTYLCHNAESDAELHRWHLENLD